MRGHGQGQGKATKVRGQGQGQGKVTKVKGHVGYQPATRTLPCPRTRPPATTSTGCGATTTTSIIPGSSLPLHTHTHTHTLLQHPNSFPSNFLSNFAVLPYIMSLFRPSSFPPLYSFLYLLPYLSRSSPLLLPATPLQSIPSLPPLYPKTLLPLPQTCACWPASFPSSQCSVPQTPEVLYCSCYNALSVWRLKVIYIYTGHGRVTEFTWVYVDYTVNFIVLFTLFRFVFLHEPNILLGSRYTHIHTI